MGLKMELVECVDVYHCPVLSMARESLLLGVAMNLCGLFWFWKLDRIETRQAKRMELLILG